MLIFSGNVFILAFCIPIACTSLIDMCSFFAGNSAPDPVMVPARGAKRSIPTIKRRRTHPWWYWTKQKAKRHSNFIDKKNQQFLDSIVAEQKSAGTPLEQDVILSQQREFTADSRRIGMIGRKIGILPYWTTAGKRGLMTVIHFPDNHVIKSYGVDEYAKQVVHQNRWRSEGSACVVVGAESVDPQEVSAAYGGLFKEAGLLPKKRLTSMYVSEDARLIPGTPLTVSHFRVGDFVDVFGKTRDWGFQGVMKRWGFKGQPQNHTTKAHRRPGSIAQGRRLCGPYKGRKMPGHMGSERRANVGLEILRIDHENQCIFVKGPAVPGVKDNWCLVYDSRILGK